MRMRKKERETRSTSQKPKTAKKISEYEKRHEEKWRDVDCKEVEARP